MAAYNGTGIASGIGKAQEVCPLGQWSGLKVAKPGFFSQFGDKPVCDH